MLRFVFCIGLVLCLFVGAETGDTLVSQAIALYETRHLQSENLEKSRDLFLKIIENEPDNVTAHYELAKVCFLMGDAAVVKSEKLNIYEAGMDYAKCAKKLDGNSAWAHFWYLVNLGRIGQTKGVLHSLGSVPEFRKEVDKVLKIDPRHTGALDAKAMLYYELPPLLGGNVNKSIEFLNEALALDSNYSLLYVDMAKVYIKKKEYDQARWYLDRVLRITKPTHEADYILDDKPEALDLLGELGAED